MKSAYVILSVIFILVLIPLTGYVFAQSTDSPITIKVDGTAFLPIILEPGENPDYYKQLFIVLDYHTNNPSLIGSKINAIGAVYDSDNGDKIAEISFPNGFIIQDEGFVMFSKKIDTDITEARIELQLTDLDKKEQLSDELEVNVTASDPITEY